MTIKFDDIVAAAETNYAHTPIEFRDGTVVTLLNALQLPEEKREALSSEDENDERKQLARFQDMVRAVADTPEGAEYLIDAAGDNLAYYVELFKKYGESTQVGEA